MVSEPEGQISPKWEGHACQQVGITPQILQPRCSHRTTHGPPSNQPESRLSLLVNNIPIQVSPEQSSVFLSVQKRTQTLFLHRPMKQISNNNYIHFQAKVLTRPGTRKEGKLKLLQLPRECLFCKGAGGERWSKIRACYSTSKGNRICKEIQFREQHNFVSYWNCKWRHACNQSHARWIEMKVCEMIRIGSHNIFRKRIWSQEASLGFIVLLVLLKIQSHTSLCPPPR